MTRPDLETLASVVGDPRRIRVLMALCDGRALPAGRLADEAGVAPSTVTGHLTVLRELGLVTVERQGRNRFYSLADDRVESLIEVMSELAPQRPIASLREGTRMNHLRRARTCYRHLAGELGVEVFRGMIAQRWVVGGDGAPVPDDRLSAPGRAVDYRLTPDGASALFELGVAPQPGKLGYCMDWTEQRHHLAGPLGTSLADRMFDLGWVERGRVHRAVLITAAGRTGLRDLGLYEDRRSA